MENEKKKSFGRKGALKALIAFVVILLALTFFSNTIMNFFIPKVVGAYAGRGNLSIDNTATGVIELKNGAVIKGLEGRIVSEVLVTDYDTVKKGDLLVKLEPVKDNSVLDELKDSLETLKREQKYYELQNHSTDMTMYNQAVNQANNNLSDAKKTLSDAKNKKKIIADNKKIIDSKSPLAIEYQAQVTSCSDTIESLTSEKTKLETEIKEIDNKLTILETTGTTIPESVPGASSEYNSNTPEYYVALKREKTEKIKTVEGNIQEAQKRLDDASEKLSSVNQKISDAQAKIDNANQLPSVKEAQNAYDAAKAELTSAKNALSEAKNQSKVTNVQDKDNEKDRLKKIEELEKKIKDTEESFKTDEILATSDGYVYGMSLAAGDELTKDTIATIIPDNKECMVTFSFSKETAKALYVGQELSCDNYYVEKCVISRIKPDPEDPQGKAQVICDLEGDLYPGYDITVTASKTNADYEQIVPGSAVYEDNGGHFIFVIIKETSVLGDRYTVKRVDVDVLATDGFKTAISAGEQADSFMLVTRSDEPLEDGQRVRITDYTNSDNK